MDDLRDALIKLDLHEGDVVFFDDAVIDIDSFVDIQWPTGTPDVVVIPVRIAKGQSLKDVVVRMSQEELQAKLNQGGK